MVVFFLDSFRLDDRDEWYQNCMSISEKSVDRLNSIETLVQLFKSLAKSLRPFCLLPPLSISDSSASSPSDKENIEHVQPKVPILSEKWLDVLKIANGLHDCQWNDFESSFGISNLSQLFVNLYILEKSINWELSAMKTATKCRVCRRKANDEMILCDKCNRGYHIYCLKPPIASIDDIEGDWFCCTCDPRPKTVPLRKNSLPKFMEVNQVEETEEEEQSQVEFDIEEYSSVGSFEQDDKGQVCLICKHRLYDEYAEVCFNFLIKLYLNKFIS